jgi:ABC-2 type transport system ATP-binding protein
LHEPEVLVLDEPTNGLDPRQIIEMRGLLRELATQCSVIVTSHILSEIERVADRVAILLHGRLLAVVGLGEIAAAGGDLERTFLDLTAEVGST